MPLKVSSKLSTTSAVSDEVDASHNENVTMSNSNTMSEYEILRQQKVQRNQEKLRSLGLLVTKNEPAARRPGKTAETNKRNVAATNSRKTSVQEQRQPPSRRMSLRLRGINPFPTKNKNALKYHFRQKVSEGSLDKVTNHLDPRIGSQQRSNKTTTKEHCQMRIQTMSIPQLQQRIRIIERARGQHCVAKLSTMYECCIESNLHELAEQVKDAIERLTTQK